MVNTKKIKGFTLVELVITITLFSMLLLLTLPLAVAQLQGDDAESTTRQLLNYIFESQQNAYTRKNRDTNSLSDKCYGVSFANLSSHQYTTFTSVYNSGTSTCDATTKVNVNTNEVGNSGVSTSLTDITFVPGSFRPLTNGTVTVTNNNNTFILIITDEGAINYKRI